MRLATLAGIPPSAAALDCYRRLDANAPDDYRQLAALLVDRWQRQGIATAGLGGGQGAGKSTLGKLLAEAGELLDCRVHVLSLDDFYLAKADRLRLAADVHPLLATRGPPGTHDIELLRKALRDLRRQTTVQVPRFDKGRDDRHGHRALQGPADIVVLEGWCVGASASANPSADLAMPMNDLERQEDADGRWRRHVDEALRAPYARLRADLRTLAFLQVPGLDAVRRWRLQQEQQRPPEQRMDAAAVGRFVQHYERITRRMLAELPPIADMVVRLDQGHGVCGLSFRA